MIAYNFPIHIIPMEKEYVKLCFDIDDIGALNPVLIISSGIAQNQNYMDSVLTRASADIHKWQQWRTEMEREVNGGN